MRRRFAALLAIMYLLCLFSTGAAEGQEKIILMMGRQRPDQSVEAVWLDDRGGLWRLAGALAAPDDCAGWLNLAVESEAAEPIGTLDSWRLSEIQSLIQATDGAAEQPADLSGCGSARCFAVRYEGQGAPEIIPLAATGEWTMENTDVDAQALCLALWKDVVNEEPPEEIVGFQVRSLAEFCGLDGDVFENATIQIFDEDCEAGPTERTLDEDGQAAAIEWLSGLTVTGKRSALMVTGNTTAYVLTSPEGEALARFTFFGSDLVCADGMYFVQESGR